MAQHITKVFEKRAVHLDGEHFMDCEFRECDLIYSGGEVPAFSGSNFDDCRWLFADAAERTLAYVRTIRAAGHPGLNRDLDRMTGASPRRPAKQPVAGRPLAER